MIKKNKDKKNKHFKKQVHDAVAKLLDTVAAERDYDNALDLCSYAMSLESSFVAEAQMFMAWRDNIKVAVKQIVKDVKQGDRTEPTIAEVLAELPLMAWPA